MLFLILSILCSGLIAIIFKFSEENKLNRYGVTVFNYCTATSISFYMLPNKEIFKIKWFYGFGHELYKTIITGNVLSSSASAAWAVILGSITGIMFFLSFWLYQYNVNKNGAALSATFMKLGVLIPTILSIWIFKEIPTVFQLTGIVLAVLAILLINLSNKKSTSKGVHLELLFLFIFGGLGDFNSKIFQNFAAINYKELYIFYVFFSALIISLIMLYIKNRHVMVSDIIVGFLVGIPNQLTSYFLIRSLGSLEASTAFPIYSSGTILFVNVVNILIFKEKLTKKQYIAIIMIMLALVLLNI